MKELSYELLSHAENLASEVVGETGLKLRSALDDYTNVSERLKDNIMSPRECSEWKEIRSELVAEVIRLINRLESQ